MMTEALVCGGLFLFYSASVLYANWRGFVDGLEKGRSLQSRRVPADDSERHM